MKANKATPELCAQSGKIRASAGRRDMVKVEPVMSPYMRRTLKTSPFATAPVTFQRRAERRARRLLMPRLSLFAEEKRGNRRSNLSAPLVGPSKHVDFTALADEIDIALPRPSRANSGRPPFPRILMTGTGTAQQARRGRVRKGRHYADCLEGSKTRAKERKRQVDEEAWQDPLWLHALRHHQ